MIKVCVLVGYYPFNRGGAEYQAFLIAEKLKQTCDVFYISIGHDRDAIICHNGYKVYLLKVPALSVVNLYFLLFSKITRILTKERPDYIYQRVLYSATGIAAMYCKNNNSKLIWHIANDPDVLPFNSQVNIGSLFGCIERKIAEIGIRECDYIIAQTHQQARYLKCNFNRNATLVIPNCHPYPAGRCLKVEPIKVVWIANIKKAKQPEEFIHLCEEFEKLGDMAEFTMVGKPSMSKYQLELESRIRRLKKFRFVGEIPIAEANSLLEASHIFVNTSKFEGFPNTFIQAWMRRNVVISLQVDPDHMIRDMNLGFCSGTFTQMVRDLEEIFQNSRLREEMADRAQRVAFERFSLDNFRNIIGLIV
jgi:glycosyltransferase involved in cell wall biosynthesis